jgi:hypothetical protein
MNTQPVQVRPYSFDLSTIVPRSVASLYSNLVTRPTGRALRIGIESQIGELGTCCLSVLDFAQVVVLDYSCADEAVAKLVHRYSGDDRPGDVYFLARGLGEQHRQPIEAVLNRYGLLLCAEMEEEGAALLGEADDLQHGAWTALEGLRRAPVSRVADALGATERGTTEVLNDLVHRRVVLSAGTSDYLSLRALLAP